MEKGNRYLQVLALFISLSAPLVLLAGYTFWLGYISGFGLHAELIPKTLTDVILESWIVVVYFMGYAGSNLGYCLLGAFALWICLILMTYLINYLSERIFIDLDRPEITRENRGRNILGLSQWIWKMLLESGGTIYQYAAAATLGLCISLLFVLSSYSFGEKEAQKQITRFKASTCGKDIACHQVIDHSGEEDKLVAEGLLISANEQKIAIYNTSVTVYHLRDTYKVAVNLKEELDPTVTIPSK